MKLREINQNLIANIKTYYIFYIFIVLGIILRWVDLDVRPIHHDESLHGAYGYYWFQNAQTGHYKYLAMLHGPLLYFIEPFFFQIFGVSNWTLRMIPALIGSVFLFIPLFLRNRFSRDSLILLTAMISLSPLLTYYSRFSRHDPLVLSCMALMLLATMTHNLKHRIYLFIIPLMTHFTIKENSYITFSLLIGFVIYEFIVSKLLRSKSFFQTHIKLYYPFKKSILTSLLIGSFIYVYLYTAEFKHSAGILDGLYRQSLMYWFDQHKIQRISGPFSFQFLVLFWYELPFVIAIVYSIMCDFIYLTKIQKYIFSIMLFICSLIYLSTHVWGIFTDPFSQFFKLQLQFDYLLVIFLIFYAIFITTVHLMNQRMVKAFVSYLFFATFFTYSYVGEKVPWLSLYPLTTGLIYLFNCFHTKINLSSHKQQMILFPLVSFMLYQNYLANYKNAGQNNEILSQVHTSEEIHKIYNNIFDQSKNDSSVKLYGTPLVNWPSTWYFILTNSYVFSGSHTDKKYSYIMLENRDPSLLLDNTYLEAKIPLRHWWSPIYANMNLINSIKYSVLKTPWSATGSQDIWFYRKIK